MNRSKKSQQSAPPPALLTSDESANLTSDAIAREIELIELETKRILLSRTRRDNTQYVADEAARESRAQAAQEALSAEAAMRMSLKNECAHRQGGFGLEDMLRGDGKASLAMQDLPIPGMKHIVCVRCGGEWKTPDPNLRQTDPDEYLNQLEEWKMMLRLFKESISRPMGGPMFSFERDGIPVHPELQ